MKPNEEVTMPADEDRNEREVAVEKLADLVDYQDGTVVSRTLLKRPGLTLTVFAFDRGQSLSPHSVPGDAVVQVLDGVAEITVGGTAHRVGAGETLLMPGGVEHAVEAVESFKMLLTLLRV